MGAGCIRSAKKLALVLCGALAMAVVAGFPATAQTNHPAARAAQRCVPIVRQAPCLGPIQSLYAFDGFGGGATSLIHAKAGPRHLLEQKVHGMELTEVYSRTFTWHSVPGVRIVAVFAVRSHPGSTHFTYRELKTGAHSGRGTLVYSKGRFNTTLLLEGSR
jgi:hypothetical protein